MSLVHLRKYRQERILTHLFYIFLWQSGKQHNKLKVDLQIDFTTGDDRYHNTDKEFSLYYTNTTSLVWYNILPQKELH